MASITRNELKELLDRGEKIALVDALPANYYAECHLPGAISLPPGRVAELAPELLPDKDRPVIVYCSSNICQNSAITAEVLRSLGYADVRRYAEGKEDWKAAGLPVESGASQ